MAQLLPLFHAPEINRLHEINAQRVGLERQLLTLGPNTHKAIALRTKLADLAHEALALESALTEEEKPYG